MRIMQPVSISAACRGGRYLRYHDISSAVSHCYLPLTGWYSQMVGSTGRMAAPVACAKLCAHRRPA